jgi:hypothetical protein
MPEIGTLSLKSARLRPPKLPHEPFHFVGDRLSAPIDAGMLFPILATFATGRAIFLRPVASDY